MCAIDPPVTGRGRSGEGCVAKWQGSRVLGCGLPAGGVRRCWSQGWRGTGGGFETKDPCHFATGSRASWLSTAPGRGPPAARHIRVSWRYGCLSVRERQGWDRHHGPVAQGKTRRGDLPGAARRQGGGQSGLSARRGTRRPGQGAPPRWCDHLCFRGPSSRHSPEGATGRGAPRRPVVADAGEESRIAHGRRRPPRDPTDLDKCWQGLACRPRDNGQPHAAVL